MSAPASPSTPDDGSSTWDYRPGHDPAGSAWDQDEGAMAAEDRYIEYLIGRDE